MKFLHCSTTHVGLDYDLIHSRTTEEILNLRNKLRDLRELRKLEIEARIEFQGDWFTVWINYLETELIESLDKIIIQRRLKEREEKRRK